MFAVLLQGGWITPGTAARLRMFQRALRFLSCCATGERSIFQSGDEIEDIRVKCRYTSPFIGKKFSCWGGNPAVQSARGWSEFPRRDNCMRHRWPTKAIGIQTTARGLRSAD